ncbi:MAG: YqgE/AlgH family protein [Neisseriaceae bacterium]
MELTDHFLIATPAMHDTIFSGSVIYITEHQLHVGAVGVVINKIVSRTLEDMFKNINISAYNIDWKDNNLFWGGPIKSNNGFFLRKANDMYGSKYELTGNQDYLKDIPTVKDGLFMSVGYSSWAPLQLEAEIRCNEWLIVKSNPELIFNLDPSLRYDEALKMAGIYDLSKLYCDNDILDPM